MGFILSKFVSPGFTEFQKESLYEHNEFRRKHNSPPLKLSKELCNFATEWAENLSKSDKIYHRPENNFGENIFWGKNISADAKTVVGGWYSEIENYDFDRSEFSPETGHFTQVIWKGTKEMGIAIKSKGNTSWVVANYNPPGNFRGRFRENVLPEK